MKIVEFLKAKFSSRKFWVLCAAVVGYLALVWSGEITLEMALEKLRPIALAWMAIEGGVDFAGRFNNKK